MAVDTKYGYVTTEHGSIGEDEPVVVFRASDMHVPNLLDAYYAMCGDSPEHHREAILRARQSIADWQDAHPDLVRIPNSDEYMRRTSS